MATTTIPATANSTSRLPARIDPHLNYPRTDSRATKEVIIDTRPGGTVAITIPSEKAIQYLMFGPVGDWHPWFDRPWWFSAVQFSRMVARGVKPKAAYRYSRAMMLGGCTRREAIEIIAQRDCAHLGEAVEIIDASELPKDFEYRAAWRRSSNGGPIWTDELAVQKIEEMNAWAKYEREKKHAQA